MDVGGAKPSLHHRSPSGVPSSVSHSSAEFISLQGQYAVLERKYSDAELEIVHLRHELSSRDKAALDSVRVFQTEIDDLRKIIDKMNAQGELVESRKRSEVSFIEGKLNAKITELESFGRQKDERIKFLEEQLEGYFHFRETRTRLEQTVAQLEKKIAAEQNISRKQLLELEHKLEAAQEKFDDELQMERASRNMYIRKKIVKLLDEETKRVLEENESLKSEILFLRSQFEKNASVKEGLESKAKHFMRELELNEQTMETVTKQGYVHLKDNKELRAKVKNLEQSLTQAVAEHESVIRNLKADYEKRIDHLETDMVQLKRVLAVKRKELAHVRALGQQVIAQRTDVENFFLQSLEEVRDMKRKELESQSSGCEANVRSHARGVRRSPRSHLLLPNGDLTGSPSKSSIFPTIGASTDADEDLGAGSPSVRTGPLRNIDIADLSWDDKERVLRLLFTKMNASSSPERVRKSRGKEELLAKPLSRLTSLSAEEL